MEIQGNEEGIRGMSRVEISGKGKIKGGGNGEGEGK